jgi:hypothetical protein
VSNITLQQVEKWFKKGYNDYMMTKSFKEVFRNSRYLILALAIAFTILLFAVWIQNLDLIGHSLTASSMTTGEKVIFLLSFLGSLQTNFTLLSASYTIAIAVLFGVNVAMLSFMIKKRKGRIKSGSTIGGFISGILGIGCAACGSVILTPLLTFIGAGWLITVLPLRGGEFGILGVALLAYSVHLVAKKIQQPATCRIESK